MWWNLCTLNGECTNATAATGREDLGSEKDVNNVFSNQFGISGLVETWITLGQLHGAIIII